MVVEKNVPLTERFSDNRYKARIMIPKGAIKLNGVTISYTIKSVDTPEELAISEKVYALCLNCMFG